jgi:hypothetical protein
MAGKTGEARSHVSLINTRGKKEKRGSPAELTEGNVLSDFLRRV